MKNLILYLALCCAVGVTLGNTVPVCNNVYDDDAAITFPLCDKWAYERECINSPDWMAQFCRKSCRLCTPSSESTITTTTTDIIGPPSQAPPGLGPPVGPPLVGPPLVGPPGPPLPPHHPTHHHLTHPPTLSRTPMMWAPPAGCKDPAMATCNMRCSAGHKTDANGCPLCECLPELCEDVTCKPGEICRVKPCFQHPCEKTEAECIVDSMCNFDRAHQSDYHKHLCRHHNMTALKTPMKPHLPECGKEGHYNPLQCHYDETSKVKQCWCVTNFGAEIEGTRVPVETKADAPDCIEQHTFALMLSFGLYHDLGDDVHHHMQGIQKSVEVQLTLWMEVEEGDIIHVEVFPLPGQYLLVYVGIIDNNVDLADAANKLDRHLHIEGVTIKYQDTDLTPDTDSVSFKHKEVPEREEEWGPYAKRNFRACYRRHPVLVVVVCAILGLFVLALPIVIMAICRRRKRNNQFSHKPLTEKSQNYKENIAFGNNLCDAKQDEKKVPI